MRVYRAWTCSGTSAGAPSGRMARWSTPLAEHVEQLEQLGAAPAGAAQSSAQPSARRRRLGHDALVDQRRDEHPQQPPLAVDSCAGSGGAVGTEQPPVGVESAPGRRRAAADRTPAAAPPRCGPAGRTGTPAACAAGPTSSCRPRRRPRARGRVSPRKPARRRLGLAARHTPAAPRPSPPTATGRRRGCCASTISRGHRVELHVAAGRQEREPASICSLDVAAACRRAARGSAGRSGTPCGGGPTKSSTVQTVLPVLRAAGRDRAAAGTASGCRSAAAAAACRRPGRRRPR